VPNSLKSILEAVAAIDPQAPEIEFEEAWWSWGDLARLTAAIGTALAADGVAAGARLGVMLRNRPEAAAAVMAAVTGGHCLVTINPTYPDAKLVEDIAKLATPVLIGSSADWARTPLAEAGQAVGALCLELTPERELKIRQRLRSGRLAEAGAYAPEIGVEMLTSGTTGPPKRIPLPAVNFEKSVMAAVNFEAGRSADDAPRLRNGVQMLSAPFAHIGGLMALLNALASGRRICLFERFKAAAFISAVARHKPAVVSTPPAALKMVFDEHPPRESLASLRAWRTGTAPLDPELADAFYEAYGIPVLQNYGATEFGGVAGWTLQDFKDFWSTRRGAVGRLNPGTEGRTVDPETGAAQQLGAVGILELRSGQIGDGQTWLRTTDLAVLDEERFLWIKGRADNVIIRGGFKIQPQDIVEAMEAHPGVREAAVAALPDARLGQVPGAAFIPKSGTPAPTEAELIAFLRERLLPYQAPVKIVAVEELPRTDSMKVSQPALRELLQRE